MKEEKEKTQEREHNNKRGRRNNVQWKCRCSKTLPKQCAMELLPKDLKNYADISLYILWRNLQASPTLFLSPHAHKRKKDDGRGEEMDWWCTYCIVSTWWSNHDHPSKCESRKHGGAPYPNPTLLLLLIQPPPSPKSHVLMVHLPIRLLWCEA